MEGILQSILDPLPDFLQSWSPILEVVDRGALHDHIRYALYEPFGVLDIPPLPLDNPDNLAWRLHTEFFDKRTWHLVRYPWGGPCSGEFLLALLELADDPVKLADLCLVALQLGLCN